MQQQTEVKRHKKHVAFDLDLYGQMCFYQATLERQGDSGNVNIMSQVRQFGDTQSNSLLQIFTKG